MRKWHAVVHFDATCNCSSSLSSRKYIYIFFSQVKIFDERANALLLQFITSLYPFHHDF